MDQGRLVNDEEAELAITVCDFKFSTSTLLNWNMKRSGKRFLFRFTAWFNAPVDTP